MKKQFQHSSSLLALSASAMAMVAGAAPALAQSAAPATTPAADAASAEATGLDQIVVTASKGDKTQLKSSVAVTSISNQAILDYSPRGEASLYRLIPGVLVQGVTDSPGGNLNIAARGVPSYVGGAEYVQLQEDGLPIVLFGDMQFGNADYWIRNDLANARVESQVGGRDSTFASQGPSAVINYISKTGDVDGGLVRLEEGVNFTQTRLDFDYGGHISDSLRFNIGGFVKDGYDPRHFGYLASKGYQIKGNITKEFDGGNGFIRFSFKRLDDQEPTYTENPVLANVTTTGSIASGLTTTTLHGFSQYPGFDARNQTNQSIYNEQYQVLNNQGQVTNATMQGIHPKETSFGGQLHYEFSNHLTIDDSFRYTDASGVFNTQFYNALPTSGLIGSTVNGQTVGSVVYADGPNQGKAFTGAYYNGNPNINTNMRDVGSLVNDLKASAKFDFDGVKVTAFAGWFHMRQTIAMDWHVNQTFSDAAANGAMLDLFSSSGAQLTANGQAGFNNNWGAGATDNYAFNFTDDAPYLDLGFNFGKLDLDGSFRWNSVHADGYSDGAVQGPTYAVSDALGTANLSSTVSTGVAGPASMAWAPGAAPGSAPTLSCSATGVSCANGDLVNYTKAYTSWSFGALYSLAQNTTVYARISRGGRFNADRQTVNANRFNADGSLNTLGNGDAINFVTQQELGLKSRGRAAGGQYDLSATLFRAQLDEHNYNLTAPAGSNPFTDAVFHSYGLELDAGYHIGHFTIQAIATYTHSVYAADGGDAPLNLTGFQSPRSPKIQYVISPSYDFGIARLGFSIDGQDGTWNYNVYEPTSTTPGYINAVKLTATTFINAFASIHPAKNLELGVNMTNVFNTLGFRSADNGFTPGSNVLSTAVGLGRTTTASLQYKF
jgi:outer membrane receptor protein involved in Fe transport